MADEIKLSFYPLDVDFTFANGGQAIRVFGITPERKKVLVLDKKFRPFFYAAIKEGISAEQAAARLSLLEFEYRSRKIKISAQKSGESELKIFTDFPADIPALQDFIKQQQEIRNTSEFDIRFYRRCMISKNIIPFALHEAVCVPAGKQGDCDVFEAAEIKNIGTDLLEPKVLAFDIETMSPSLPNTKTDSIIMIGFYGSNGFQKVITWKRFEAPEYVQFVDGEQELISEFIKTMKVFSPDILVGYGSDNFDFRFLSERAAKYGIRLNINTDGSEIVLKTKGRHAARTTGFQHLDI